MAYDRNEPNASQCSARYAERKRAASAARDAALGPQPCLHCPELQARNPSSLFCPKHLAEHEAACDAAKANGTPFPEVRRTYWPERKGAPRAPRGRITDAQRQYLARLLNEAFANLAPLRCALDARHLDNVSRAEASFAIDRIKACKANGWKPLIEGDEFWFWRGCPR